jgi:uncharacterized protein
MSIENKSVYFGGRGPQYTEETLRLAKARAEALGIHSVVVASYTGETGAKACQILEGCTVVVVAGVYGFREPNQVRMQPEHRATIERHGGQILHTGHAFGMLGRAVNKRFGAIQVDEVIAHVLRLFSQGLKVGCEIACMAADAGLIRSGEEVIAIGGSGQGADTAIVLKASNTHTFFDTRILEIICKPRE